MEKNYNGILVILSLTETKSTYKDAKMDHQPKNVVVWTKT